MSLTEGGCATPFCDTSTPYGGAVLASPLKLAPLARVMLASTRFMTVCLSAALA